MRILSEEAKADITELLLGHKVSKITSDMLVLDDGTKLTLSGNWGCAGCESGNYELSELNGVDNVITAVEFVDDPSGDGFGPTVGVYKIFVYADNQKVNLATFSGTDGNGYYGTGYRITVEGGPDART